MAMRYFLTATGLPGTFEGDQARNWIEINGFDTSHGDNHLIDQPFFELSALLADNSSLVPLLDTLSDGNALHAMQIVAFRPSNQNTGLLEETPAFEFRFEHVFVTEALIGGGGGSGSGSGSGSEVKFTAATAGYKVTQFDSKGAVDGDASFAYDYKLDDILEFTDLNTVDKVGSGAIVPDDGLTYFLTLDGINGVLKVGERLGYFKVADFEMDFEYSVNPASGQSGRLSPSPLSVALDADLLLPVLARHASTGKILPGVELIGVANYGTKAEQIVTEISLKNAAIDSFNVSNADFENGYESISFDWEFLSVETTGTTKAGADRAQTTAFAKDGSKTEDEDVYSPGSTSQSMVLNDAALDYTLFFDGIEGESQSIETKGWIDILSFDVGVTGVQRDFSGSGASTPAHFEPFRIEVKDDSTLTEFTTKLLDGKSAQTASIVGRAKNGDGTTSPTIEFLLEDVLVSKVVENADGGFFLELDARTYGVSSGGFDASGALKFADKFAFDRATNTEIEFVSNVEKSNSVSNTGGGENLSYYVVIDGMDAPTGFGERVGFGLSDVKLELKAEPLSRSSYEFGLTLENGAGNATFVEAALTGRLFEAMDIVGYSRDEDTSPDRTYRFNSVEILEVETSNGDVNVTFNADAFGGEVVTTNKFGSDTPESFAYNRDTTKGALNFIDLAASTPKNDLGAQPLVSDYFISIDRIGGQSSNDAFKNWSEISDFAVTTTRSSKDGSGVGKVDVPDITIHKLDNTGLTEIMQAVLSGNAIEGFEIVGPRFKDGKPEAIPAEHYKFGDIFVSNVTLDEGGGYSFQATARELGFETNYADQKTGAITGTESFGFDIAFNKLSSFDQIETGKIGTEGFVHQRPTSGYLKLDGIDGEVVGPTYAGWHSFSNFSFSLDSENSNGASRSAFSEVKFDLKFDKAAPIIAQYAAMGKTFGDVDFEFIQNLGDRPGFVAMDIDLKTAVVSSYQIAQSGEFITIGLSFDQISMQNFELTKDGSEGDSHGFGWDVVNQELFTIEEPSDPPALSDSNPASNFVYENAKIGTTVGLDVDANVSGSFFLSESANGLFAIDASTGVVSVAGAIDRETTGLVETITVGMSLTDGGTVSRSFTIAIGDRDEFDVTRPEDVDPTDNFVNENSAAGTGVGVKMFSSDGDAANNQVTYSIPADPASFGLNPGTFLESATKFFAIDPTSGVITVLGPIDFETLGKLVVIPVLATSVDGSVAVVTVDVSIGDLPGLLVTGTTNNDGLLGSQENDTITADTGRDKIVALDGDDEIDAGGGNDRTDAGAGDDTVRGDFGADYTQLGDGDDFYFDTGQTGRFAKDTVYGGNGEDFISTGGSGDRAWGGNQSDTLVMSGGNDRGYGGLGDDLLYMGTGNDFADGGSGKDQLDMGSGRDTAVGGDGSDYVLLGQGHDTWIDNDQATGHDRVFGNAGRDWIEMRGGNDTVTGGADEDTFVLYAKPGHDEITDFKIGFDRLVIDDALMEGPEMWSRFIDESSPVLSLRFDEENSITFSNIKEGADLEASIVMFSELLA